MKKRVLLHILAVVVTATIVGSVFYAIICIGLKHSKQDAIGKYNYITSDTTHYNTVFFGASSVHLGLNPKLFDSITGSNSYNASMDGIAIAEINLLIKKYVLSHGAPENIFIAFDEPTVGMERGVWYFPQYYPFVNDTDLNELKQLEPKLHFGQYLPALAVTYFDDPLKNLGLIGLLKDYHKKEYTIPAKGFLEVYEKGITDSVPQGKVYFAGCDKGWAILENTLKLCAQKNIKVNFVLPPRYNCTLSDSSMRFVARLQSYQTKYHTSVFDFVANKNFSSQDLFANQTHLNAIGAQVFTTLLAKEFLAQQANDSTSLSN